MEGLDMADDQSSDGKRMGVPASNEPADGKQDSPKVYDMSLAQRLAAIRAEASGIGKEPIQMQNKERTKSWTIQAHTIEGILHGMRGLLDRYRVWMEMSLVERSYTGNRCDATFAFTFESLDDPADVKTIQYAGAGTDNSDKAFAKAGTNALKEMLKKQFQVTDREDAKEEEDRVEHQSEDGVKRADLERSKEETRKALAQWASTFKASIESAPDLQTIKRLERENKDQLASENLPEVTRTFFVELIVNRKRDMENV